MITHTQFGSGSPNSPFSYLNWHLAFLGSSFSNYKLSSRKQEIIQITSKYTSKKKKKKRKKKTAGKESACHAGDLGLTPWVGKIRLEKGKATHTSILAWRIPWTVQFTRSQSQTHWATLTFTFTGNSKHQQWRLEKAMALHSCTLAWKIPWTEEPGGLQSMGSLGVGHNSATSLSIFTFLPWRRKWQPTPTFLSGESQGRESLVGCRLWGCTESDTTEAT